MNKVWIKLCSGLLMGVGLAVCSAWAELPVPEPLQAWVTWALHDIHNKDCPLRQEQGEERQCAWPSQLQLTVTNAGATFSQHWRIYGKTFAQLPGDDKNWPQDVQSNGQSAVLLDWQGRPALWLEPGEYTVTGVFAWDKRPEFLPVSADPASGAAVPGVLLLKLDGEAVAQPEWDSQGRVWLRRGGQAQDGSPAEENRLDLRVFRKLADGVPVQLTTRLELDVAGRHREILLGPLVPPASHWQPLALECVLPARLEPDGKVRIQVRPGSWVMEFTARHHGDITEFQLPVADQPWPAEEIWSFAADHSVRMVEVEDGVAIDPQQTGMPVEWKNLPAYRMLPQETLRLTQKRRGDPEPEPDKLSLERALWLDFDGKGYTLEDHVYGSMTKGWRLEMSEPAILGRVRVNGEDQFITRLASGQAGVEVRRGDIDVRADSRIEQPLRTLPASGWQQDFHNAAATLHLPPGWRLLHAQGVDNKAGAWLQQWDLSSFFLVMITSLAIGRLWSVSWGLVAFATLALTYHEVGAPQWLWLNLTATLALLRLIPKDNPYRRWPESYLNLSLLAMLFIVLPFITNHTVHALFPQTAQYAMSHAENNDAGIWPPPGSLANIPVEEFMKKETAADTMPEPVPEQNVADELELHMQSAGEANAPQQAQDLPQSAPPAPPQLRPESRALARKDKAKSSLYAQQKLMQTDPNAQIQTGPGLPNWQWQSMRLEWNGSVQANQQVTLYLLPPPWTRLLGLLQVLLCGILGGWFLLRAWRGDIHTPDNGAWWRALKPAGAASAVLAMALTAWPQTPYATEANALPVATPIPTTELLDELRERLLRAPECHPNCAVITQLRLELAPEWLVAEVDIHASAMAALPLPGTLSQWQPDQVLLDDAPASALRRDEHGQLWIAVPPGIHRARLHGSMPARATVQLALPLPPRRTVYAAQGWRVDGVHENGIADSQLQFSRDAGTTSTPLELGALPPFVEVERILRLGLDWQVETTVRRLSPADSAIVLELPLLPGESITSEQPRVENGHALLNIAPGEDEIQWLSVFAKADAIELIAPDRQEWVETWKLEAGPLWHVEASGIPVVHHQHEGRWLPAWRPWPGERIDLTIQRPEGVPGQLLTIDRSQLTVTPGLRATDSRLRLTMRTSRGGPHRIHLPQDATLLQARINDLPHPLRPENGEVSIPLHPGSQSVELEFRQPSGIHSFFRTPPVRLNNPSVNATVEIKLADNRWLWLAGGPTLGPAVLFWGVLLVLIALAPLLARIPSPAQATGALTPLRSWDWLLLGIVTAQQHILLAAFIFLWLLALGARRALLPSVSASWKFNLVQTALLLMTVVALASLADAMRYGLLASGQPEMFVQGNGSSEFLLRWYQDRVADALPQPWVFSLPMWVYRLALLLWAAWLAFAFLRWLPWMWACLTAGDFYRPMRWAKKKAPTPAPAG